MRKVEKSGWIYLLLALSIYTDETLSFVLPRVAFSRTGKLTASQTEVDTRPHDHRAKEARKARRLNHAFRYLYRHNTTADDGNVYQLTSEEFLAKYGGYTQREISAMHEIFPPLLELDVRRHLRPKLLFMKATVLGESQRLSKPLPEEVRNILPPHYFGARLERAIAPRHAFLQWSGLPHGKELLMSTRASQSSRWSDFLKSCRNTKHFAALCNRWRKEEGIQNTGVVTSKQIEAFDTLFQRGLMAAARDDLCQHNNTWPLDILNITSADLITLLVQHGANPSERDNRGVSLLHWVAGSGHLPGVQAMLPYFTNGENTENTGFFTETKRDGATPLHWAAAGASAREFGIGGHPEICRYILDHASIQDPQKKRKLVNQLTRDGNSALMWAAWSGTLDTVKLLIRERADPSVANANGCTVAHWAASGGNLAACQYLATVVGVDFKEPNHGGNTPLTHAVAFGRVEVVEWLRNEIVVNSDEDDVAASLAWDFVDWTDGDEKRRQVLSLFEDWYGHEQITRAEVVL